MLLGTVTAKNAFSDSFNVQKKGSCHREQLMAKTGVILPPESHATKLTRYIDNNPSWA